MKKKTFKIVTLVLSLALVIGMAISVGTSAADEKTPSLEIISKNLSYGGTISIAFAVDANDVDASAISLDVYYAEPTSGSTPEYTVEKSSSYTVHGVDCTVFFTNGIPAKEMTKQIFVQAKATVDGETVYSEIERYSVAEYAFDMQYRSNLGADFEELGAALLTVGEKVQTLIPYDTANRPSAFRYVAVESGTVDGKYSAGIFKNGTELTLTYDGTDTFYGWDVTYFKADGTVTQEILEDKATLTVGSDNVVAKPLSSVATFENGTILVDNIDYNVNGAVIEDPSAQSVATVVDDPIFEGNSVLLIDGSKGTAAQTYMQVWNPKGTRFDRSDRYSTFEADFYIDTENSGGSYLMKVNFVANGQLGGFMFVADGSSFKIVQNNSSNGGSTGTMFTNDVNTFTEAIVDNWVNLRFEYHEDGLNSRLTIYINDKCVVKDYICYYYANTANTDQAAKLVEFTLEKSTKFYIDNISFNTSATAPKAPKMTVYNFDDGNMPAGIVHQQVNADDVAATVGTNPKDSTDSVLDFGNAYKRTWIYGDSLTTSSGKYVLEADMYIELGNRSGLLHALRFHQGNGEHGEVFGFNINNNGGKIELVTAGGGGHTSVTLSPADVAFPVGEWFKLRVEYTLDAANSTMSVYINGQAFCENVVTYSSGYTSGGGRVNVASVRWDAYCHSSSKCYLDDITFAPECK